MLKNYIKVQDMRLVLCQKNDLIEYFKMKGKMVAGKPGNVECGQSTWEFGIMGAMVYCRCVRSSSCVGFSLTTQLSVSLLLICWCRSIRIVGYCQNNNDNQ